MIIFDLDGTLIDSNRRGLAPTPEYTAAVARSIFPVAADFTKNYYALSDSPEEIMAEWEALAYHHYHDLVPLKPGALELLSQYWAQNIPMALFTACRPRLCHTVLKRFDLTRFFRHIIFAEEIGLEKHDSACFLRLSELIGAPPEACILLDDSPSNIATAAKAGMGTIGIYDSFYDARQAELRQVSGRYIRSLEELLEG